MTYVSETRDPSLIQTKAVNQPNEHCDSEMLLHQIHLHENDFIRHIFFLSKQSQNIFYLKELFFIILNGAN